MPASCRMRLIDFVPSIPSTAMRSPGLGIRSLTSPTFSASSRYWLRAGCSGSFPSRTVSMCQSVSARSLPLIIAISCCLSTSFLSELFKKMLCEKEKTVLLLLFGIAFVEIETAPADLHHHMRRRSELPRLAVSARRARRERLSKSEDPSPMCISIRRRTRRRIARGSARKASFSSSPLSREK